MKTENTTTQAPLSATEKKLLAKVQANVKPRPAWVKFFMNTLCGLY